MRASLLKSVAIVALATLGLSACGGADDLDAYINEIKARPGGRIEPIPTINPYEVFTYIADAEGLRSPFQPDTPVAAGQTGGVQRPEDRVREYLEQYSLDTLAMVGTLNQGNVEYGLIHAPDGLIHRVVQGQYLGQNDGRITEISESKIQLVEIISDGIGGYIERDAAIGLND